MARPRIRPHLFLRSLPAPERFTSTRMGGSQPRLKKQNRLVHGRKLQAELEAAAQVEEDHPIRIEFRSEPGLEIALKSLDSTSEGSFELLSVRKDGDETLATVLVPRLTLKHFRKVFEEYLAESTRKGRPKHEPLVANIAAIRRAALLSIWTDDPNEYPTGDQPFWWEAWIRRAGEDPAAEFRRAARSHGLRTGDLEFSFVDRIVITALGTERQMAALFEDHDALAELRAAKTLSAEFLSLPSREQAEWARNLASRIKPAPKNSPAVCILDTGVNRGHVLLEPVIERAAVLTCNPRWGVTDHHGHGTEMAGLSAYGDLGPVLASNAPLNLTHSVESVKILPPEGENEREVYGAITQEAVARVEMANPKRARAVCLTVMATDGRDRGRPSSWSAAIDEISAGTLDGQRRLFCLAAGNADRTGYVEYPHSNATDSIHDPGQSWNALTVGAMADRVQITERKFVGWKPIAKIGDLAPSSTTSETWPRQRPWPIKPEIVMPAGNAALTPDGKADFTESLSLLTTHWMPLHRQFVATGETSAAAALAARLAARIQAKYQGIWPETVRALIVHSAEWTEEMKKRFPGKKAPIERLRWFGFGVPDEAAALFSADDALTLVAQHSLQPFDERVDEGRRRWVTRDMHLYELPWPKEVLLDLGSTNVELRITLSYFVEPNPGERGWQQRHRYASHALRFAVINRNESVPEFRSRINRAARAEGEEAITAADHSGWVLGPITRAAGSIHSDRWYGIAADLADRNVIAVYPGIGWWRERPNLERWGKVTRYALIVSIRTPTVETDIYTPVANQIGVPIQIPTRP